MKRNPHQRLIKLTTAITGDAMTNGVVVVPDSMKSSELAARISVLEGVAGDVLPSYPFSNQTTVTIAHNLGRFVTAKAYLATGQEITGATSCPDLNTVTVYFSTLQSGTLVLS